MLVIDQSKQSVRGKTRSQKLIAGKYKNVKVLVKKLSEFAAGLSDFENDGGVLFIKFSLVKSRTVAVTKSRATLRTNPFSVAWNENKVYNGVVKFSLFSCSELNKFDSVFFVHRNNRSYQEIRTTPSAGI